MWGQCNGWATTIMRLQQAQLVPCRQDDEAAAWPSGSHSAPPFSFPQLDHRPEPSGMKALQHATSSLQSHGEPASSPTPSSLARSLSPRSTRLMAAVLAAAGDDELIQIVARAHSSKAVPPLAHTLRHRLQEPSGADGEAEAAAGTDHTITLWCTGMAWLPTWAGSLRVASSWRAGGCCSSSMLMAGKDGDRVLLQAKRERGSPQLMA